MKPIISIENLGKKYLIRHKEAGTRHKTFREALTELPAKLLRRSPAGAGSQEEFWALRDVTFDVMPGERVGIIGRNGAGKSTLLKLLSRITEPTTGKITLRGRAASLLEVGTGFHPELTGRENIYLNGAVLGMARAEVSKKFDEIVDFAGVEQFLDTPVKRYSSGMYVRLGFAVAAHLEPEILIVDEVLAVGDAEFQKKCLGKMDTVSKGEGRTVLFVSHNMTMIQYLCPKSLFLQTGHAMLIDKTEIVMQKYIMPQNENINNSNGIVIIDNDNKERLFKKFYIKNYQNIITNEIYMGYKLSFIITAYKAYRWKNCHVGVIICDTLGRRIAGISSWMFTVRPSEYTSEIINIEFILEDVNLLPGSYTISLYASEFDTSERIDIFENCSILKIMPYDIYKSGHIPSSDLGMIYINGSCVINDHNY